MGGKSSKVSIPRYNMSIHYGICIGPVDAVEGILIGEKIAFSGVLTASTTISLIQEGLFGGIQKEGGVNGSVEVMMGDGIQVASAELASRLGDVPSNLPGFRGIVTAFFRGNGFPRGFYWAASNPYLKTIWFKIRKIHSGLGGPYAAVPRLDGSPGAPDNNPAHMIYACFTDTNWGMGEDAARIDAAGFQAVAQVLYNEGLGLSMQWTRSGTIEDFVNQICQHINGVIFTHPRTGLLSLRLIRNDYDLDTLRTVTVDNARLTNFGRKGWGETVNEMKVTWTNPLNEKEETVYSQDLGNIAMQQAVISDSRNYFGVRYAWLAQLLADRDLRAASATLCSVEAEADRSFWDITPYECIKLVWPEYGISGLIMRVTNVSYGTTERPTLKLSLLEDVFSLPKVAFTEPPSSAWVNPAQTPVNVSQARIIPAPAYALLQDQVSPDSLAYPSTLEMVLVPSPYTSGSVSYSTKLSETTASGAAVWVQVQDTQQFAGRAQLVASLAKEATSIIAPPISATGPSPWVDSIMLIGSDTADPATLELALVTAVDSLSGNLTLLRGVLDTVPKAWAAGTRVWSVPAGLFDPLPVELTAGQTVSVKIMTHTSLGQTDESTSPVFSDTAKARPTLPIRPANVKLNGVAFGTVSLAVGVTTLALTWAHRNRLLEDVAILPWTGGSLTPEAGTTYVVEADAYDPAGALLAAKWFNTDVGLVDHYTIDLGVTPAPTDTLTIITRVYAMRGGEKSWQAFESTCTVVSGFGLGFGQYFGE